MSLAKFQDITEQNVHETSGTAIQFHAHVRADPVGMLHIVVQANHEPHGTGGSRLNRRLLHNLCEVACEFSRWIRLDLELYVTMS